ncbi:Non-specific serine/threonine protein kinase [Methylobacterium sp. 4-46]|uniref:RAD55 family ATPase n=1 Tax=unclassified Methylobacterium TaxID=2615210 RepID=UPI000152BF2B|nr:MULTISPECIES: ATPase domain-containing protein [Methylobacterium]ACA19498.1 Non-specific serine/threonine protein kinase [Methylobacterium sp. 4-46]WFT78694.1 ATPase domain-containing protein [Methylobacterium nodulans]
MTGAGASTTRVGGYGGLERVPTGIAGLDEILGGGLFEGGVYIVQGTPGSGKTILANQVCFTHAAAGGRRALYVTLLAESHARMLGHIAPLGFFDSGAIPDRLTYLSAFRTLQDEGLSGLLTLLRREAAGREASLIVLDGVMAAEETADSAIEFKKFIHELQTQAAATGATILLLTSAATGAEMVAAEHTMVDGLIELSSRPYGRRSERDLEVRKFRGSGFLRGRHVFRITDAGVAVYPRTEARLREPSRRDHLRGPKVPLGVPALDGMLDGGLPLHSTTLLAGPSGIGKTTLGLQFLGSGAEPGLLVGFHESAESLKAKAEALGLAAAAAIAAGEVGLMWQPATEGLIDEVCDQLLATVRNRGVRRVFLDGLDAMSRLAEDGDRIIRIVAALTAELRALNVTSIVTMETDLTGLAAGFPLSGVSLRGASAITENILLMRFVEQRSALHRMVSVIKARDSAIDQRLRCFAIRAGGLVVEDGPDRAEAILAELQSPAGRRGGE